MILDKQIPKLPPLPEHISKPLERWSENHIECGGSVWIIPDTAAVAGDPVPATERLFTAFKQLKFEAVESFVAAEVTDNSMPFRSILEDASKIHYLRQQIKDNKLKYIPQLVHQPWDNRYRVHPGSGRFAALCMEFPDTPIPSYYVHFGDKFTVPAGSIEVDISDPRELLKWVMCGYFDDIEFEFYPAFTTRAQHYDSEWKFTYEYGTDVPWEFIRFGEGGTGFIQHKREWRDTALDLWASLNS